MDEEDTLACFFIIILVCIFVLMGSAWIYCEYSIAKKYYPEITFMDYVFIGDKLKITPDYNDE
jgi:hypothetical protein